jgi:TolB-like protein/Tfp pilus assembly protein PilF
LLDLNHKHAAADALEALDRIERSQVFARAGRQRNLLRHLVEKSTSGRSGEIKEITIAIEVFGRASYDPQVDALVRVEIGKLRRRLESYYAGEGAGDALRIEIPRGSYEPMFVDSAPAPAASVQTPAPVGRPTFWRWIVGAAAVTMAAAIGFVSLRDAEKSGTKVKPTLAILALEDLSPTKDGAVFAEGLCEELLTTLARLDIFRVLPRSSVGRLDRSVADAVVEGSVRHENGRFRVQLRLSETKQNIHLWQETYDRDGAAGLLPLQIEIANSIATALHLDLPAARLALIRQHTANAAAYTHYLHGALLYSNDPLESIEHYRLATAADPSYALAWAGLAMAYMRSAEWERVAASDVRDPALAAAEKAVSLNADSPEAQHAYGLASVFLRRDWQAADRAFRRAIELDGANTEHRWEYARAVLSPMRRFDEAAAQVRAALAVEPFKAAHYNELASIAIRTGKPAQALQHIAESRKISPRAPAAVVIQGVAAAVQGDETAALRSFEEALVLKRSNWALGQMGFLHGRAGQRSKAQEALRKLTSDFDKGVVYLGLGERQEAWRLLRKAAASWAPSVLWMDVDYRFNEVRDSAEYNEVLDLIRLGTKNGTAAR